jgi:hypothetical protein
MAATAGVVAIEPVDRVEPELTPEIRELGIDAPAEARLERAGDVAGEAVAR